MVSEYIQIISKIVPKNNNDFKLVDLQSIDADLSQFTIQESINGPELTYPNNILAINVDTFEPSGLNWNFNDSTAKLTGNLMMDGQIFFYSDKRLKDNIIHITNSIDLINKIEGVQFDWINNNQHDYGVIAQQLQKILPQAVITQQNTLKRVNYVKMIPFLIQYVKQLNKKIEVLQKKINQC